MEALQEITSSFYFLKQKACNGRNSMRVIWNNAKQGII
jgi:hypothetical protein